MNFNEKMSVQVNEYYRKNMWANLIWRQTITFNVSKDFVDVFFQDFKLNKFINEMWSQIHKGFYKLKQKQEHLLSTTLKLFIRAVGARGGQESCPLPPIPPLPPPPPTVPKAFLGKF